MPRALPIAQQLRRAIKDAERRGMSRAEIARRAGVSGALITQIADGKTKNPRLNNVEKILHACGYVLKLI
jgi:predicted transcriptional regulator